MDEPIDEILDRARAEIEMFISLRDEEQERELIRQGKQPPYPEEFWKGLESALIGLSSALDALDQAALSEEGEG